MVGFSKRSSQGIPNDTNVASWLAIFYPVFTTIVYAGMLQNVKIESNILTLDRDHFQLDQLSLIL
jgi:hypothetical protein